MSLVCREDSRSATDICFVSISAFQQFRSFQSRERLRKQWQIARESHPVPLGEGTFSLKLYVFSLVVDHRDDFPNEKNQETDDHGADDDA
jgi:hypothetical protein